MVFDFRELAAPWVFNCAAFVQAAGAAAFLVGRKRKSGGEAMIERINRQREGAAGPQDGGRYVD